MRSVSISVITFSLISFVSVAQTDIPLSTWRMHISYNSIRSVTWSEEEVFSATENGIMVLDRDENSIRTYNKLNGLAGASINVINFDKLTGTLLVGYEDGGLDIIQGNVVTNYSELKNAPVTGSKQINHILFHDALAYLATNYGVVIFDINQKQVKETWRDLGVNGVRLSIFQSTMLGDSIFLASENGMLAGDIDDNLLDFNNWKRFSENEFNTSVQHITTFNDRIIAVIDNDGLYEYDDGAWSKMAFLENADFHSVASSTTNLVISADDDVWRVNTSNVLSEISSDLITSPQAALEDEQGIVWIGDQKNGLLTNSSGSFQSILPNGPAFSAVAQLGFNNNTIYAVQGGYTSSLQPLDNDGTISYFANGQWTTETAPVDDVTDVAFHNDILFVSSFGDGVQRGVITTPDVIYTDANSSLINTNPPGDFIAVSDIEATPEGLWAANYGASSSLHFYTYSSETWQAFSPAVSVSQYPVKLASDFYGSIWATLDAARGGGLLVFNHFNNEVVRLTDQAGAGQLPSRNVWSLALDRNGYMWVGTDKGVAYFVSPSRVFAPGTVATKPIFENRFLLSDEKITAITVDDGDRKWIGTEKGVWLFNPTGESLVYNFTEDNSPIPSNNIQDIAINRQSGEVFIATDKGIVSFRADATEPEDFQQVKIFPNPVTTEFSGTVGISGLATDAVVKITDVSGKLLWQTRANGGTATWHVRDHRGRRATTGVYLVFAATQDGTENFVGKIAVVE